jgi:nucleotide-binding universal stress UspA family protein
MNQDTSVGRLERLLLASDGTEHSSDAVRVAIDAARKCGSHLMALTMVLSNPEVEAIAPQLVAKGEMKARDILDAIDKQAAAAGVTIERLVRHGQDPGQMIVNQAAKRDADLIVMGRRGVRGLARMFVGEATVKVCGHARSSVLVVPKGGGMPSRRILVATDGSVYSDAAAKMADRMSRLCRLPVSVISVVMPGHGDGRRSDAAAAVERIRSSFGDTGVAADGEVIEAERPEAGIVDTARKRGADLIIIGSHGRSGLVDRVLIGSVSERVLGEADCAVMVVKSG